MEKRTFDNTSRKYSTILSCIYCGLVLWILDLIQGLCPYLKLSGYFSLSLLAAGFLLFTLFINLHSTGIAYTAKRFILVMIIVILLTLLPGPLLIQFVSKVAQFKSNSFADNVTGLATAFYFIALVSSGILSCIVQALKFKFFVDNS